MNRDELYKQCRWCKWFDTQSGKCTNDRAFSKVDDIALHSFSEDGTLAAAIEEGFNDFNFSALEQALFESKLSKKRVAEIMRDFNDELESAFTNWTESIDSSVSVALNNYDFGVANGTSIADPHDFHCKYFW